MDKREQLERLSNELLGRLKEANDTSKLFFPFEYTISKEIEDKYFKLGSKLRSLTIANMVIIDNSFKKFTVLPFMDILETYVETQRHLLDDWQEEAFSEYEKNYGKRIRYLSKEQSLEQDNDPDVFYNETQSEIKEEDMEKFLKSKKENTANFRKVLKKIVTDINEASKPAIKKACSSEEARLLDVENKDKSENAFSEIIHNAILNLFK